MPIIIKGVLFGLGIVIGACICVAILYAIWCRACGWYMGYRGDKAR